MKKILTFIILTIFILLPTNVKGQDSACDIYKNFNPSQPQTNQEVKVLLNPQPDSYSAILTNTQNRTQQRTITRINPNTSEISLGSFSEVGTWNLVFYMSTLNGYQPCSNSVLLIIKPNNSNPQTDTNNLPSGYAGCNTNTNLKTTTPECTQTGLDKAISCNPTGFACKAGEIFCLNKKEGNLYCVNPKNTPKYSPNSNLDSLNNIIATNKIVLNKFNNLGGFLSVLFSIIFYIAAFLMFLWAVWGVFQYIFAGGDKNNLKKARDRITWAIVGFLILTISFAISQYAQTIFPLQGVGIKPLVVP